MILALWIFKHGCCGYIRSTCAHIWRQLWLQENGHADDLFQEFVIKGANFKRCPFCRFWVEKSAGCGKPCHPLVILYHSFTYYEYFCQRLPIAITVGVHFWAKVSKFSLCSAMNNIDVLCGSHAVSVWKIILLRLRGRLPKLWVRSGSSNRTSVNTSPS